jgi:YfiH family protein
MIDPDWPAPAGVRALVTTRAQGDMAGDEGRKKLRELLPDEPAWMRQVHGVRVIENENFVENQEADAATTRRRGIVCAVKIADCMPVLLADDSGTVVGIAHAGWRGLSGGVIEATIRSMRVAPERLLAWLGPAIGPNVYEVGEEVRAAFAGHEDAFAATRPGHWNLDLYAVARQRIRAAGVKGIYGGSFCTYSDSGRFFSWRRDRDARRMAAAIWLT